MPSWSAGRKCMDDEGEAAAITDSLLIAAASGVLAQNHDAIRHTVGAALLASSGKVYTAVHLGSARINVCAEEVALGAATSAGERRFSTIVAVAYDDTGTPRV